MTSYFTFITVYIMSLWSNTINNESLILKFKRKSNLYRRSYKNAVWLYIMNVIILFFYFRNQDWCMSRCPTEAPGIATGKAKPCWSIQMWKWSKLSNQEMGSRVWVLTYSSANAIMQGYFFAFAKVLLRFQIPVFQGCIIMEQHLFGPNDMVLQS